jgi:hypothetical protein
MCNFVSGENYDKAHLALSPIYVLKIAHTITNVLGLPRFEDIEKQRNGIFC